MGNMIYEIAQNRITNIESKLVNGEAGEMNFQTAELTLLPFHFRYTKRENFTKIRFGQFLPRSECRIFLALHGVTR